jgi:hypothetical protein
MDSGRSRVYQYQLSLIGTALTVPGQAAPKVPWLSTLTMAEFMKLLLAGWAPCGIAWGVVAVHVHAWDASPFAQRSVWKNAEMEGPTAGMMAARTLLEREARTNLVNAKAGGAVKMTMDLTRHSQVCQWGSAAEDCAAISPTTTRASSSMVASSAPRSPRIGRG